MTGRDIWAEFGADSEIVLTCPATLSGAIRQVLAHALVKSRWLIDTDKNIRFIEEAEAAARYCLSKYHAEFGTLQVSRIAREL